MNHIYSLNNKKEKYNNKIISFIRFTQILIIRYPLFHRIIPFERVQEKCMEFIREKKKQPMVGCILLDKDEEHIFSVKRKFDYNEHYIYMDISYATSEKDIEYK